MYTAPTSEKRELKMCMYVTEYAVNCERWQTSRSTPRPKDSRTYVLRMFNYQDQSNN